MLPESFCPLPWINLSTDVNGSLRPCCRFKQPHENHEYQLPNLKEGRIDQLWNDDRFQNLRQAFLDGKKPKECNSCWDEESSNNISLRQTFAEFRNIPLPEQYTTIAEPPVAMDLKLNNICNLKCRICGPMASSTFLKEYEIRTNQKLTDGLYWCSNKIIGSESEAIFKAWAENLIHIEMTGGEPMTSPENVKVLEILNSVSNRENIGIIINTNATYYNQRVIDKILNFRRTQICLSVDDIGGRIEYQRYPIKFNDLLDNIEKYKSLNDNYENIDIVLFCTVSNLNIFYLDEYLEWARKYNFEIFWNLLYYEPWYSIKNLPNTAKAIISDKYSEIDELKGVVEFLNLTGNYEMFTKFKQEIKILDLHRGQRFSDTFKEYALILGMSNDIS